MAGYYELSKNDKGQFHFVLKAGNHEIILSSEMYEAKANALKGIASVQNNGPDEGRYERKTSKNDKAYFNLKARNGEIIGSSQMYASEASRDKGIASVMANAASDTIKEMF